MCTLRNFPHLIEHCIEWSRDHFEVRLGHRLRLTVGWCFRHNCMLAEPGCATTGGIRWPNPRRRVFPEVPHLVAGDCVGGSQQQHAKAAASGTCLGLAWKCFPVRCRRKHPCFPFPVRQSHTMTIAPTCLLHLSLRFLCPSTGCAGHGAEREKQELQDMPNRRPEPFPGAVQHQDQPGRILLWAHWDCVHVNAVCACDYHVVRVTSFLFSLVRRPRIVRRVHVSWVPHRPSHMFFVRSCCTTSPWISWTAMASSSGPARSVHPQPCRSTRPTPLTSPLSRLQHTSSRTRTVLTCPRVRTARAN